MLKQTLNNVCLAWISTTVNSAAIHWNKACGGDQGYLSGTVTEIKTRRPWLLLGWLTTREDRAL